MSLMTPVAANEMPCPMARTFKQADGPGTCRAHQCPVWRWLPLQADDPDFKAAIKKAQTDHNLDHKKAVAYVAVNRAEFGLPMAPTHGWCGLGGEPRLK